MKRVMVFLLAVLFTVPLSALAIIPWTEHDPGNGGGGGGDPYGAHAVDAADIDGDGDIDIALAANSSNQLIWFENIDFAFQDHVIANNFNRAIDVVAYNRNPWGDTDIDILGAAYLGHRAAWYDNNGAQSFNLGHWINVNYSTSIGVADVNLDGSPDYYATGYHNGRIHYCASDGAGGYNSVVVANYYGGCDIISVDLDDDGDLDLVTASGGGNRIDWWENTGPLTFIQHSVITGWNAGNQMAVAAGDMNSDGHIDLVATALNSGELKVMYNDGNQVFLNNVTTFTGLTGIYHLAVGDMNDDGGLDIVAGVPGVDGGSVFWWLNNLDGTFNRYKVIDNVGTTRMIRLADMNLDGYLDIVVAVSDGVYGPDGWFWIENGYTPFDDQKRFYGGWTLMSLPMIPTGSAWCEDIIGDDIIGLWQLIGFTNDRGFYPLHPLVPGIDAEPMEHGRAYWIGIAFDEWSDIDMVGTPYDGDYTFDLDHGWNMLGYPFTEGGSIWDWQWHYNGNTYTTAEAAQNRLVVPVMHVAAPEFGDWGYWYHFGATQWIEPWYGFWLLTLIDGLSVTIPDPVGGPEQMNELDAPTPEDWMLHIVASEGDRFCGAVGFGANADADDGFDCLFDFPVAPSRPEQPAADLYFDCPDWLQEAGRRFARDIRNTLSGEEEWSFIVEGNGEVSLSWPNIAEVTPGGYGFELANPSTGETVDMLAEDSYTFDVAGENEFIVTVTALQGVDDEPGTVAPVPGEFALESIYPNPFNPETTVIYSLPRAADVKLQVFDINGREVTVLVDGYYGAGMHSVSWQPGDLSAGVYFVRMQAGDFSTAGKMLYLK